MIKIDITLAISLLFCFSILLVFLFWIIYNSNTKYLTTGESGHLEQCPYCTLIFFDYRQEALQQCPRCQSYLNLSQKNPEKRTEADDV